METGSDTTGGSTTLAGTTGDPTTGGGMFTATMLPTGDDDTGDSGPGEAMIVFPAGTRWDFLFELIGETDVAAIEVLNIGSAAATNLGPGAELGPYFDYTAGRYPGELGNCGDVLDAGEICTVHIVFTPTTIGPIQDTLVLSYEGGPDSSASLTLLAEGRGTTASLVDDPGFEACAEGTEPAGWMQTEGAWTCETEVMTVTPYEGALMLAVTLAEPGPFEATYRVDLSELAGVLDGRDVTGSLSVHNRAIDGDEIGVQLRYLDGDDAELETFAPPPATAPDWTEVTDERLVPTSTRAVELTVRCLPQSATCDAFVDDATFTLTL